MVTHVEWWLHWNMHKTGLQYFSSKKTAFPLPSALPGVVWGRASRWDAPASLPISQGFFSPRSCPSHPAHQESAASHVCCRGTETKPSLCGRAGCGTDAGCRDPHWPCLPPFPWLPAPSSAGRHVWAAPAHLCVRKEKIQTGDFLWGAEHRSISLCAVKPKGHLENFFCQERS